MNIIISKNTRNTFYWQLSCKTSRYNLTNHTNIILKDAHLSSAEGDKKRHTAQAKWPNKPVSKGYFDYWRLSCKSSCQPEYKNTVKNYTILTWSPGEGDKNCRNVLRSVNSAFKRSLTASWTLESNTTCSMKETDWYRHILSTVQDKKWWGYGQAKRARRKFLA